MSSFSMVLLEGGVDVEVDVDFADMTSIFDEEVPKYTCGEFGFTVTPGRGEIGGQWIFMVSAFSLLEVERELVSLGRMEVEVNRYGNVTICIPPRVEQTVPGPDAADWDGKLFGAFVFQLLNSLYDRGLIELPGILPKV
jgi:hypothetical protein